MDHKPHQPFTELEVWKKERDFKKEMQALANTFPPEEKHTMRFQLIKSSRSINANITEGHGRFTYKDQLHFCIQATDSLSETLHHLIGAFDRKYITQEKLAAYKPKYDDVERLLNGYIAHLRGKL